MQKIKILNLPDTGTSVSVTLDSTRLSIASDSSFSFNTTDQTAGMHAITVIYSNAVGARTLTDSFTIIAPVSPRVKLSSNISIVTNLVDPLIITATNLSGGGANPLYTFAGDRSITAILQPEGSINSLSLSPAILAIGANRIYARMRTSDTCYTVPTNIDSVQIIRNAVVGIVDPDFADQPIEAFPNPFSQSVSISGFNRGKIYWITINNSLGEIIYQQILSNGNTLNIATSLLSGGSYWLNIFDYKKSKLIGTMLIFKK